MKMKLILITFAMFVCASLYSYNWDEIADSIASQQKQITRVDFHYKIEVYRSLRKSRKIMTHYENTFAVGDTIIIMEYHDPYKGATHSALWTKGHPDSFMTYNKYFDVHHDYTLCYFSIYMRNLCEEWNLSQIRKEESDYPPEKPSFVISTRLILKPKDEYVIESIFFEHFYLYPRDKF